MASVIAYREVDLTRLDLHGADPINQIWGGSTPGFRAPSGYGGHGVWFADYWGEPSTVDAWFGGGTIDGSGLPIDGSFDGWFREEGAAGAMQDVVEITGFHIAAADVGRATASATLVDDQAILRTMLSGNDMFALSGGNDTANGFAGNDRLYGRAGSDVLYGSEGNDRLDGDVGADTLHGGAGDDRFIVDNVRDVVVEAAAAGVDTVFSQVNCTLAAHVERLVLTGSGNVAGTGNALANAITGNAGANRLLGAGGIDRLDGGAGADLLAGGTRNDILTGGTGHDRFLFSSALSDVHNVDRITDFEHGSDQLWLSRTVFAGVGAAGPLAGSAFVLGSAAGDANDRIVYDAASGGLYFDADGSGSAAQVLFARVAPGTAVGAADLWVV